MNKKYPGGVLTDAEEACVLAARFFDAEYPRDEEGNQ